MTDKKKFCIKFKNMLMSVCHNHFRILKKVSGETSDSKQTMVLDRLFEDIFSPSFLMGVDQEIKEVIKSADISFDEFKRIITEHEVEKRQRSQWYYNQEFTAGDFDADEQLFH